MTTRAAHVASGKVREIYAYDSETLALVASDRISTFDVVLPTPIPDKGRVLTGLSAFWFGRTRAIVPNHLLEPARRRTHHGLPEARDAPDRVRRSRISRRVRAGRTTARPGASAVTSFRTGSQESARLPEPIFTPATKAAEGHDENITEERAAELCGESAYREAKAVSSQLYRFGRAHAEARGMILADTKFELGVAPDGSLVLGDEAMTPDSSRFWPASGYAPGAPQPSFDKQFVRDWCERTGWNKEAPGPELPDEVVEGTRARYIEAFERLTEVAFAEYVARPEIVL